jgi:hypothetical protein
MLPSGTGEHRHQDTVHIIVAALQQGQVYYAVVMENAIGPRAWANQKVTGK